MTFLLADEAVKVLDVSIFYWIVGGMALGVVGMAGFAAKLIWKFVEVSERSTKALEENSQALRALAEELHT